jgi:ABC-type transport system substrate-binding protein
MKGESLMSINFDRLKRTLLVSALIIVMLSSTFVLSRAGGGSSGYEKWGPRVDYLQLLIAGSVSSEAQAFRAGATDVMDWPLDYDNYMAIKDDPDFVLEPLTMFDIYDIDINCLRWPTSDYRFRQAIAHLIDYEWFYTNILHAYAGELMDNIIWWESEWTEWYNSDAPKYWYNATLALEILEAAGYKNWDSDPELEYNNGTIYDLPPLEFWAREDDPIRSALGTMINEDLNAVGIPTEFTIASMEVCWDHAYVYYTYHLYTAGMGPFRDVQFLYDYYHSQFATPEEEWAWNNVFFINDTYDGYVEALKFAPDLTTAEEACKEAQAIFMDQVPLIPVYHSAGSTAYRAKYGHHGGENAYWDKPWNGFVNSIIPTVNSGVSDWWSLLNAHPGDVARGGVLRFGMLNELDHVNPVTSYSVWDAILLNELYGTLVMRDPLIAEFPPAYVPWFAKEWTVETWDNGGVDATKLTFKLFDNIKWSDGTPLNSSDVAFTMKYMYDTAATYYANVEKIDGIDTGTPHIETPDATTVIIYFNVETVWALDMIGVVPIIPKHVWETIPPELVEEQGEFVYGANKGNLTCSGPYVIADHLEGEWWLLRANPYFFRAPIPGDANGDAVVDGSDFFILLQAWGTTPPSDPRADFNGDGVVDGSDFYVLLVNWGQNYG